MIPESLVDAVEPEPNLYCRITGGDNGVDSRNKTCSSPAVGPAGS